MQNLLGPCKTKSLYVRRTMHLCVSPMDAGLNMYRVRHACLCLLSAGSSMQNLNVLFHALSYFVLLSHTTFIYVSNRSKEII